MNATLLYEAGRICRGGGDDIQSNARADFHLRGPGHLARESDRPLLHICYAPADHEWVHGRMVHELGLADGQYRTRADGVGELQLEAIARAVDECRFTVLIASSASRWDALARFAATLAQHAGLERQAPRLIVVARDFTLESDAHRARLSLEQRALIGLDCSDEAHTVAALAQLRKLLELPEPVDARPACPYPGLERFTAANRDLLFGRDGDKDAIVQRVRGGHTRILVVGPSGSGKSSLIHAAVLPELSSRDHLARVVPRGGDLVAALRATIDALEVPGLGATLDQYVAAVGGATDAEVEEARARLRAAPMPDARRRVVVVDPLEEIFAEDDADARETLFCLLGGLWSLPWCTVILCMRADFYGALMAERCWHELETSQYPVAPLDDAGLRDAIVEPARHAGVHVDAALVERLIREIDRDRSSVPLPLLQVALKELWAHLRWRYLTLADYERIVNHDHRGLAAVLAVHAESVVQALTGPGDRSVAQRILLDLVHLGEGRPHTRRRRTLDDLRRSGDAPDQVEHVLEKLVEGRLVTTSDGDRTDTAGEPGQLYRQVDLAHDTLITGWPGLAGWIAERRDDLRTQRRLEARAAGGGVLTGDELSEYTRWVAWLATPAGQALGASEALRAIVRRSVRARRFRRGALVAGLTAATTFAIVFGLQTRQLREEQTKTQRSIGEAAKAVQLIVFEVDDKLRTVAGASRVRETLLQRSRELLAELRKLGDLEVGDQRTAAFGKVAQADLALERGHLPEANTLYLEVLADTQKRVAGDPKNPTWQGDLAVTYRKLGDVAVSAGKLGDARGWFDKALAVAKNLAAADPSNAQWQRGLATSYQKLGDVAMSASRLEDARGWFDKSLALQKTLAATDPNNTAWQRDLSASYQKLGEVAVSAGKLGDARSWFDKALAVQKILATADPSNAVWQRDLSASYMRLGNVAVSAGKIDDAHGWFHKALTVTKTLADADPSNTDWQSDLTFSYYRLGDVAVSTGKLDNARGWFDKALAVAKALTVADPSNTDWQRDLSVSYNKLGDVAVSAGKLDDARGWFDKSLAIRMTLAAADPSNTDWQRDLAVSYERLGEVAVSAGTLDGARGWFEKALAVQKTLAAADPSNTISQRDIMASYERLGTVAVSAGKLDNARGWFDKALTVQKTLAAADPSNTTSQRDLAISYDNLGTVAMSTGKLDDARGWFDKARAIQKTLAAANPSNIDWEYDLAASYDKLGDVAMSTGKLDDARDWLNKVLAIVKTLAAADPSNTSRQRDLAGSYDKLGDVAISAGKLDDARGWFDKAFAIQKTLAAAQPSNTTWQRDLAVSYERLGVVTVSAGKLDDARGWFDKALAVRKTLAEGNPSNVTWQRELCTTLGEMSLAARDPQESTRQLGEARSIYGRLQRDGAFRKDFMFAQLGTALDLLAARIGKVPALRYSDPRLRSLANHANFD